MVIQIVLNLIPIILIGCISYLTYMMSIAFKSSTGMLSDLCWLLPKTPVLDAFLMFIIKAASIIILIAAVFAYISNHGIISLEILFFFSLLMLILFHTLKESRIPLVKEM